MIHLGGMLICWLLVAPIINATDKPSYRIFSGEGQAIAYDSMIAELATAQVVLFGEIHNNALVHWLELQVAQDLYEVDSTLVLGLEMLEADDQLILDEYLEGTIEERHFTQEAKLWDNYATDYQPLVAFAKNHKIPVVATNVPRRYASLVSRQGLDQLDSLSPAAKQWIAPLPVEVDLNLPSYQSMLTMMEGTAAHGNHQGESIVQAQALKDATMAYFIHEYLPGKGLFLHVNGSYHSDHFEGIYWYLKQQSEVTIKTVSCIEQPNLDSLATADKKLADFVIVTPDDMTKTY